MTFAIIETGGKQYKIEEGGILKTEKIAGDFKEGDSIVFDKVLLLEQDGKVEIGTPYILGATIEAKFVKNAKGKKIDVIRFRPKSRYHRKYGHRQPFTEVVVGKKQATTAK